MYFFTVVFDIKYVAIADMIKTIELETKQFQVSVWGKIYNSLKNSQCVKYIPNVNPPSLHMNLYVESFIVSFSNSLFVRIKIETLMNKFEIEQYAIILSIEMPKAKNLFKFYSKIILWQRYASWLRAYRPCIHSQWSVS